MTRTRKSTANLLVSSAVFAAQALAQAPADTPLQLTPDHATVSVADLDREVAWFQRVLGFKVAERIKGADFEVVHMTIPTFRIDVSAHKGAVGHRGPDPGMELGWMHIVFKTPDIEAAYNQLVALQADVKEYKNKDSTINRLLVHDPEGNEIEIQPPDPPPATAK
jgi:catechol 2,3-dioxygenase-like lactoylglutathione lyase family enzyme